MAHNEKNIGLLGGQIPSRGTILCVFQDATLVHSIEPAIARNGFALLRARSAMHGLWMATTASPNVILTDIPDPANESDQMLNSLAKNRRSRDIPVVAFVDSMQQPGIGRTCLRDVAQVMFKQSSVDTIIESVITLVDASPSDVKTSDENCMNRTLRVDAAFSEFAAEPAAGSKFRATYRQRMERTVPPETTSIMPTALTASAIKVATDGTRRMTHEAHDTGGLPISRSIEERLARYTQRDIAAKHQG